MTTRNIVCFFILIGTAIVLNGCSAPHEFTVKKSEKLKEMLSETESSDTQRILTNNEIASVINGLQSVQSVPVDPGEFAALETSKGTIIFKFFPDSAANHCANFKRLANSGFYDWTLFHRVITGFMIQGGSILSRNDNPSDDSGGNPGYTIDAEFNGIKHVPGIVSMARGRAPNTAGSQFFIMHGRVPGLDHQYSVFGEVVEGLEVVDAIATAPRDDTDHPLENIYLKKARVFKPELSFFDKIFDKTIK
ncbi:peptidylprolyl isomerase [candidate division KSB1 bacterium]